MDSEDPRIIKNIGILQAQIAVTHFDILPLGVGSAVINSFQTGTVTESGVAHHFDCARDRNFRKIFAINEHAVSNIHQLFAHGDGDQVFTKGERIFPNIRNTVRHDHILQTSTHLKGLGRDSGNAISNICNQQAAATVESSLANGGNMVRYLYSHYAAAAIKRIVADFIHRLRNHQHINQRTIMI